jgi:nitronate monooxygenase
MGHLPDQLPRKIVGQDSGRPLMKYSTDSPLRTTTGDLETMAALVRLDGLTQTIMEPAQ